MAHPGGRPSLYTNELATEICDLIAGGFKSLKTLCEENPHWPDQRTIRDWVRNKKEFSHMYAQAKDDQADLFVEEMLEIADNSSNDTITKTRQDGSEYEVCNNEWINRSRLRVDTRKWIAAKFKPKKYGDTKLPEEKDFNQDEINEDRELAHRCQK
jgi:hypothetical protein